MRRSHRGICIAKEENMQNRLKKVPFLKSGLKMIILLFKLLKGYMILYVINMLLSTLLSALMVLVMVGLYNALYIMYDTGEMAGLILPLAVLIFYFLILALNSILENTVVQILGSEKVISALTLHIVKDVICIDYEHFENDEFHNQLNRAMNIANSTRSVAILNRIMSAIDTLVAIIGCTIALLIISPWLVLIAIISVIPTAAIRIIRGKYYFVMKFYSTPQERIINYLWALLSSPNSIREQRIFNTSDFLRDKWIREMTDYRNRENEFQKKSSLIACITNLIQHFGYGFGILISFYLLMNGIISIGAFAATIDTFVKMQKLLDVFFKYIAMLEDDLLFINDYFLFLENYAPRINGKKYLDKFQNFITLKNVSYKYPNNDNFVLKNIDLKIQKNQKIAIVGVNGSGKSTFAKIILGLLQPTEGVCEFDNFPLSSLDSNFKNDIASAVFQDYRKYVLSFRDNVAISQITDKDNEEKVMKVLEKVDALKFIQQYGGIDQLIGKQYGGVEISEGQWQRLAIARAMFKNSQLIVLDEPTSALDPLIEKEVYENFLRLAVNKTTFIITHRVISVYLVDYIIVMDDGRVIETGTHDELMKINNGYYKKLFLLQSGWYR